MAISPHMGDDRDVKSSSLHSDTGLAECMSVLAKAKDADFYRMHYHLVRSQAGLATCHSKRMAQMKRLLSQPLLQGIAIAWHA